MAYPMPRCLRYELLSSPFATTAAARDVNGNDKEHSVKRELVFPRASNLQRCATNSYAREINDATPEPLNPFFFKEYPKRRRPFVDRLSSVQKTHTRNCKDSFRDGNNKKELTRISFSLKERFLIELLSWRQ